MPSPTTNDELLELVRKSGVVDDKRLNAYLHKAREAGTLPDEPGTFAGVLVRDGILTQFQAEQFLLGKWRRFTIGKYKVLERIGTGGMGSVYLCEHKLMRRRVAVKVLPAAKADDSSALERFQREARAVAALDHPNIVRAYDIDQEDNLHFLVMEYVDGSNLQEIIRRTGPLDIHRAAHYVAQAALALQHAYDKAGIIHRDIKPGNILVDRQGNVKVLDMGLARFFHDEEDLLTQKYDENVLGTADYLAPEQALDSHGVDIRADIYSLGATMYFCLTGKAPFSEGTVAQKLIWHQTRQPKPIRAQRDEVPEELAAVAEKMMAKDPNQRYRMPFEVADALVEWTQTPIAPPPPEEMPQLSPAAMGTSTLDPSLGSPAVPLPGSGPASRARKQWQVPGSPTPRKPSDAPSTWPPPEPTASLATPATAPAAAARTELAPLAAFEPEPVSWEHLTADTQEALASANTDPIPAKKLSARHLKRHPGFLDRLRQWPYFWWLVGGSAAAVVLLVVVLWWTLSGKEPPRQPPGPGTGSGPTVLRVQRSGFGDPYTVETVRDAFARAKAGTRIEVAQEVVEEQLDLTSGQLARDITLVPAPGKSVVWKLPAQARASDPLLRIAMIEGLQIKGFTLDGLGRVKDLVTLSNLCPGLVFEDLQLRGFTHRALTLINCEGLPDRPVRLHRLQIQRTTNREIGLFFDALGNVRSGVNQHIIVSDCRVEGSFPGAVVMTSPTVLRDVVFPRSPNPETVKPDISKPKKPSKPPSKS